MKVGDKVTRWLAGKVPMELIITEVTDDKIVGSAHGCEWEFDPKTGAEIDDHLEWGPKYGITGSYIEKPD